MKAYFQHPDTGEACWASYECKVLVAKTDLGEEILRKPAATARDAERELARFGVEVDEARLEAD